MLTRCKKRKRILKAFQETTGRQTFKVFHQQLKQRGYTQFYTQYCLEILTYPVEGLPLKKKDWQFKYLLE